MKRQMVVPTEFADDLKQARKADQEHETAMGNAGGVFLQRYWVATKNTDLKRALDLCRQAVEHTPADSPDLPDYLNNLGVGLRALYAREGQMTDLEEAIQVVQSAIERTPASRPALPGYLNNLANGLRARYVHTGCLEDLEEAIRAYRRAVEHTPADSPDRPLYLNNLGSALRDRYTREGRLEDLEEAIKISKSAAQSTPANSPDLPGFLNDLGIGLSDRYARKGRLEDLEEAIRVYQRAVQRTPADSPDLPIFRNNLGTGLSIRYAITGQQEDLEEAIGLVQSVLQRTPPDSPDLPMVLNDLGARLSDRYALKERLEDLENVRLQTQYAVQLMQGGRVDRRLYLLGKLEPELPGSHETNPVPKSLNVTPSVVEEDALMVKRYGHLQFPRQVPLHQSRELKVAINREQIPGADGQVKLELTAGNWPLRVQVSLVNIRQEDFLVVGSSSGVVEVPRTADSEPLVFTLQAQSLGPKKIRVRFEQDGMYLGTAIVSAEVVAQPVTEGQADVEEMPTLTGRAVIPDLTIYVEQVEGLAYTVRVRKRGEQVSREIDRIKFPTSPERFLEAIIADLNAKTKTGLSPSDYATEVKKIGNNLFGQLFHEDGFKAFYWQEMSGRPEIKTVLIVSDEPYVPWEILRPAHELADGTWQSEDLYLCERFALARWLSGPGLVTQLRLLSVALVVPSSNLQYVAKEVKDIQGLLSLVEPQIGDVATLETLLQSGQADVLHFACHGRYDAELPGRSELVLGNRRFRPWDLVAENRNFVRTQPLVFLNACDSGREGVGLTGLDGWASAFLRARRSDTGAGEAQAATGPTDHRSIEATRPSRSYAGAFLGSVWKTTDERASEFAAEFYRRLLEGQTIGEAVRLARAKVKQEGDATYLSYTLYANPSARAVRPVT